MRSLTRFIRRLSFGGAVLSSPALFTACARFHSPAPIVTTATATAEIAAARARSNAAIAAHDTDAIAREWMPDVHVVSSLSTQTAGAIATARSMQAQFTRRPDTKWVREPDRITVNVPWDVASEEGHWTGTWTDPDGPIRITGTYLAQWRHVDGRWLIQAEVFVPLLCEGGAYCRSRP